MGQKVRSLKSSELDRQTDRVESHEGRGRTTPAVKTYTKLKGKFT